MFSNAKWIWTNDNTSKDSWVRFKKSFNANGDEKAILNIGAETKYYLYLNDKLVIFDGGLFRSSSKGNGYYDVVDLSEHLVKGENELVIDVWFYGNGGRNNEAIDKAGLIFECDALDFVSDSSVLCSPIKANYHTTTENPAGLYGGYNIGYDKTKEGFDFVNSTEYGIYGIAPFNMLEKRPIPFFRVGKPTMVEFTKNDNVYTINLPYAMQCTPCFVVDAKAGAVIDIRSDRYIVKGGPGDTMHQFAGHRYEYICADGEQHYMPYNWIFGEKLIFTIKGDVKVLKLGYIESGYDTDFKVPVTKIDRLNILLRKCARTLKVCMRENFMDCPDRERGQWIGDVSVQAPQVFLSADNNAIILLKKAIYDFIRLRNGDILQGNVPGDNSLEHPMQSLNAISHVGLLGEYYAQTNDKQTLADAYDAIITYLQLWSMNDDGLTIHRKVQFDWFDHNHNKDEEVMENCWYYMALKFAKTASLDLGKHIPQFIKDRIASIEANFDKKFWKGTFYASTDVLVDDRANALAVISGLAKQENYPYIRDVLLTVFNSTTYMEMYVLQALCEMGYKQDAYNRMMCRYQPFIDNENSTLWEDFFLLGTRNHAWSGAPLTIIARYFPELVIKYEEL